MPDAAPPPLKLFRHTWGVEGPLDRAVGRFAGEGYAGVETSSIGARSGGLVESIRAHGLELIAQAATDGPTVADHVAAFRAAVETAASAGAAVLVCHSGRDAFDDAQARHYFAEAARIEAGSGVEVNHETHRGRILFNPWRTRDLLEQFEGLHLCADLSHFCVVAEGLDWPARDGGRCLPAIVARTRHVHARVGYPHGPQVPDPSAPEAAHAVETHLGWWDAIRDARAAAGAAAFTVTPEFGPPGYLHTLPHTGVPVADLPTVVRWMADRLIERYGPPAGG